MPDFTHALHPDEKRPIVLCYPGGWFRGAYGDLKGNYTTSNAREAWRWGYEEAARDAWRLAAEAGEVHPSNIIDVTTAP